MKKLLLAITLGACLLPALPVHSEIDQAAVLYPNGGETLDPSFVQTVMWELFDESAVAIYLDQYPTIESLWGPPPVSYLLLDNTHFFDRGPSFTSFDYQDADPAAFWKIRVTGFDNNWCWFEDESDDYFLFRYPSQVQFRSLEQKWIEACPGDHTDVLVIEQDSRFTSYNTRTLIVPLRIERSTNVYVGFYLSRDSVRLSNTVWVRGYQEVRYVNLRFRHTLPVLSGNTEQFEITAHIHPRSGTGTFTASLNPASPRLYVVRRGGRKVTSQIVGNPTGNTVRVLPAH